MTHGKDLAKYMVRLLVVVCTAFAVACVEEEGGGDIDMEACNTLMEGMGGMAVEATLTTNENPGPPIIADDGNRYDVALPQPGGEGFVFFNAFAGSTYVFFLTAPVAMTFTSTMNEPVVPSGTAATSPACPGLVMSRVTVAFPPTLASDAFNIKLGPTSVTTLGIAIEQEMDAPNVL
jgi:hypothetical protein